MKTITMLSLLGAIHAVESDCGQTSRNELQITPICVRDTNRIVREAGGDWQYAMTDRYDLVKSRGIATIYLCHYGERYRRETGKVPTAEVYARIWNGGPNGWRKPATVRYWNRVKARLQESGK